MVASRGVTDAARPVSGARASKLLGRRVTMPGLPAGDYTLDATIARVRSSNGDVHKLRLYHRWPVRRPRPYLKRDDGVSPLITGQRVIDTFFPQLKGGKGAVPGPFGAGKTVVQQQIARWSNADIVIYVGCGERGNELVDVLETFPELDDPYTGRKLMERHFGVFPIFRCGGLQGRKGKTPWRSMDAS